MNNVEKLAPSQEPEKFYCPDCKQEISVFYSQENTAKDRKRCHVCEAKSDGTWNKIVAESNARMTKIKEEEEERKQRLTGTNKEK